jgi:hypothetical protein
LSEPCLVEVLLLPTVGVEIAKYNNSGNYSLNLKSTGNNSAPTPIPGGVCGTVGRIWNSGLFSIGLKPWVVEQKWKDRPTLVKCPYLKFLIFFSIFSAMWLSLSSVFSSA